MRRIAGLVCFLFACGDSGTDAPDRPTMFGTEARPADLKAPSSLEDGELYPLVMVLHGYGASGFVQQAYFGAYPLATSSGTAFVIAPDGTVDGTGKQFWNADPLCCDFGNTGVDDVAYLGGILDDILASDWPIDPERVFLIGHSNGGYMSYRMACERSDIIAAIAPLAGNAASAASSCTPDRPVNVLHMHGTADDVVPFTGTTGADPSVRQWAQKNGCGETRTAGAALDLERNVDGTETRTETVDGCPATGKVELWTIEGGSHVPAFVPGFTQIWFDWFGAHARASR
jgi:polyhydroxybutyrate depolymerase